MADQATRTRRYRATLAALAAVAVAAIAPQAASADHVSFNTTGSFADVGAGPFVAAGVPPTRRLAFDYAFSCNGGTDPIYTWELEYLNAHTKQPFRNPIKRWQLNGQREASGRLEAPFSPGFAGFARFTSRCSVKPGNESRHAADAPPVVTGPIILAPYITKPSVLTGPGVFDAANKLRRKKRYLYNPVVTTGQEAGEGVTIYLRGAGVKVTRNVTFGADGKPTKAGALNVPFRTTKKKGKIKVWAVSRPYGKRSNTISFRVR